MSFFDNSTVCCAPNSSPATYHSYMCKSKGDYNCLDNEKLLKTVDYDQLWSVSQEQCTIHNKTHHISKLRSILSETISHITKDSKLLKGESVELTLEIELMKTENHTPSNSMVEVTIIQHNKKGEGTKNNKFRNTNLKQTATTNSYTSETASQKRRNWFQRVISRQNGQDRNNQNATLNKHDTNNFSKKTDGSELYLDKQIICNNNMQSTNKHPRSNFIKVLPEKLPISGDFTKGYRRVSPEKKTPAVPKKFQNLMPVKGVTKKKSVVKKLSEIFLPAIKSKKNKAVTTALTALKNEVDNIKLKTGKENERNKKSKRAPVHNLGKLVGNILDDMMATSNNTSNNEIKDNSLPLKYQHFFEPVSKKSNVKRTEVDSHKKRTTLTTKGLVQSHSDTCCVQYYDSSDLNIKTSHSVTDCISAQTDSNNQIKSSEKGDSTEMTSTKKFKEENKNRKKSHRKHAKGDAMTQFDNKVARKRSHKNNKTVDKKKSIIEWNGQTVKINKEIKTKIEMLIVNELQNLALKEGMECDVIPLHSSENYNNQPVEKMSSFFCELDISDKKLKKNTTNKKPTETKPIPNQAPSEALKKDQHTSNIKQKTKTNKDLETKVLQPLKKDNHTYLRGNLKKPSNNETGLTTVSKGVTNSDIVSKKIGDYNNDLKITYINTNIKNWSTESNILKFKSSETSVLTRHNSNMDCSESPIFKFGEDKHPYQKAISSGFIKKIGSNDSTWRNGWLEATNKVHTEENRSKQFVTMTNTKSTVRFSSATSNECQSSIEIELDIKDLELILKEAKQKQKADRVLVTAKCKRENKKQRTIQFTGKNSPAYTNQLLTSAVEKLEKHVGRKIKQ